MINNIETRIPWPLKKIHSAKFYGKPAVYTDDGRLVAVVELSGYRIGREAAPEDYCQAFVTALELLEAAQEVLSYWPGCPGTDDDCGKGQYLCPHCRELPRLRAVVAKAERRK